MIDMLLASRIDTVKDGLNTLREVTSLGYIASVGSASALGYYKLHSALKELHTMNIPYDFPYTHKGGIPFATVEIKNIIEFVNPKNIIDIVNKDIIGVVLNSLGIWIF